MLKNYNDPRHRPITAAQVREELEEKQRREQEERQRPIKEAEAQLTTNYRKLIEIGRKAVLAKQPDPAWELPESARNLKLPADKVGAFIKTSSDEFLARTPAYYRCDENQKLVIEYLITQKVAIADANCFTAAFNRLRELGLVKESPAEAPPIVEAEPQPEPESVELKLEEKLTPGFDLITGAPKMWTEKELWHLSSADVKKAFRMWVFPDGTDRRPTIGRSLSNA